MLIAVDRLREISENRDAAGGIQQGKKGFAHLLTVTDKILRLVNDHMFQLTNRICNEWVIRAEQPCRSPN
ncbi:hypothetical protein IX56_06340 [Paracoccus sanguinis]|uniref:Uncharacterized protein n=1 Tax=Paracoccus sanguinis TaxID=1545044 RepID=A0A099GIV3_9RHOB|nr:hypothetical protein IX56_06340 [Paracoccus sanguinis]